MRRTTRSLLLLALAVVALASACEKPRTKERRITLYPVGESADLALDVRFPDGKTESTTCGSDLLRLSYLLSIDTGTDGWDYRLLFSGDSETLYGCPGPLAVNACSNAALAFNLEVPQRVMLEALDVAPENYLAALSGVGVFCRGVADVGVLASDITSVTDPPPTQDPNPEELTVVTHHTAILRMLKVGGTNPMPFVAGPAPVGRFGAAASFSNDRFKLGPASGGGMAGKVALAGGVDTTGAFHDEIHLFDPVTLAFTVFGDLQSTRAGLTATAFSDSAGNPAILFAGGANIPGTASQSNHAEVVSESGVLSRTLGVARAFPAAVYMGTAMNVVMLSGGEAYDSDAAAPFLGSAQALNSFEYFVPGSTTPSPAPTPCGAIGTVGGAFCTGVGTMSVVRAGHRAEYLFRNGAPHAVVIGGQNEQAETNSCEQLQTEGNGGGGQFASGGSLFNTSAFPATAILGKTGITGLDGRPVAFGGFFDFDNLTANDGGNYVPASENADAFRRKMRLPRGMAQATTLRDSTVLITGGTTGVLNGYASVERFIPFDFLPGVLDSAGSFEFVVSLESTCDPLSGAGCESMTVARYGHTATRLEQTRTWLDGSVLIAGGSATASPPAELFVPALTCSADDNQSPVGPGTGVDAEPLSNPTFPELCDRNRAGQPITNPADPNGAFAQ